MQVQRPSSRGAKCASHSSLDVRVGAREPPSRRYRKRRLTARASISSRRAARRAAVIRGIADTHGRLALTDRSRSVRVPSSLRLTLSAPRVPMKILFVHPGPLLYTNVFLRLEPLGLELVAEAARRAKHAARLLDLQVESHADYHRMIAEWQPDFIAFSCNYLANVPEIVDLAKAAKRRLPRSFICVGGHSASFTAQAILEHGEGAIDCVLKGEGEASIVKLLEAVAGDRGAIAKVPGAVTSDGEGPRPAFVEHLDDIRPARDLVRKRHKYFIGVLDPCASIEFSRGCPWDCSFCSAWTFYGRSYRLLSPERV